MNIVTFDHIQFMITMKKYLKTIHQPGSIM